MSCKIVIPNGDDVPWQVMELMDRMGVDYWVVETEVVA